MLPSLRVTSVKAPNCGYGRDSSQRVSVAESKRDPDPRKASIPLNGLGKGSLQKATLPPSRKLHFCRIARSGSLKGLVVCRSFVRLPTYEISTRESQGN